MFSHKECNDKNSSELQEMCFEKGVNWNDQPTSFKRGRCIVKEYTPTIVINKKTYQPVQIIKSEWVVDNEIPIFSQDKNYINKYVFNEE